MPTRRLAPWERKRPVKSRSRKAILGQERVQRERRKYLDRYGGKCEICGSTENRLTFHHLAYPEGKWPKTGWIYLRRELDKYPRNFVLLCMRCHKMVEFLLNPEWRKQALVTVDWTEKARQ